MKVSNLSFGASSLGGVFHNVREAEGIKAVHTAVDNGMNFIDVSPYYGHYKAEIVLGKALKDIPRDKYYLSTKVGLFGETCDRERIRKYGTSSCRLHRFDKCARCGVCGYETGGQYYSSGFGGAS